jgi:hypothetical protein
MRLGFDEKEFVMKIVFSLERPMDIMFLGP